MPVHWVKLSTHMFDDEKIKAIRAMPSGDSLCLIWTQLICLAGKTNDRGQIYLSEDIPYTDSILANSMGHTIDVVRLALQTFKKMGMIDILENDRIALVNWEKYQNIDGLEKVREQTRLRVEKYRQRIAVALQVTHGNALESESEEEKSNSHKPPRRTKLPDIQPNFEAHRWDTDDIPSLVGWVKHWSEVYPLIDAEREMWKALDWAAAHPEKHYKRWWAYLSNWIKNAQSYAERSKNG